MGEQGSCAKANGVCLGDELRVDKEGEDGHHDICPWLLQQQYYYSSTTTPARVIVPRVIAVGQHCSNAPRSPLLSYRLKCETTGRSATAPELDDKGSPRGAAYRCTHIGRGHNATTHSFLSAIVKAVLAV